MLSIQKNATAVAAETASSRFQIAQASRQHVPRARRWQQRQKRFRTASNLCKRSSGPTCRFALLRSGTASYVRGEPSMYPRSSTARESTVAGIAAPFCARTRRSPSPTATGHRQVHCSSLCAARSGPTNQRILVSTGDGVRITRRRKCQCDGNLWELVATHPSAGCQVMPSVEHSTAATVVPAPSGTFATPTATTTPCSVSTRTLFTSDVGGSCLPAHGLALSSITRLPIGVAGGGTPMSRNRFTVLC